MGLRGIIVDRVDLTGEPWVGAEAVLGHDEGYLDITRFTGFFSEVQRLSDRSALLKVGKGQNADDKHHRDAPLRIMLGDAVKIAPSSSRRAGPEDMESMQKLLEAAGSASAVEAAIQKNVEARIRGEVGANGVDLDTETVELLARRLGKLLQTREVQLLPARLQLMRGKKPYLTQSKFYVGMGPCSARSGDVAALFPGALTPYVLRPRPESGLGHYEFLGETYCDGIMDGEAAGEPQEDIYLV